MNKLICYVILGAIFCACGGDDDPTPGENKAPTIPTLTSPLNNLLCTNNELDFFWNESTDPEGDDVSYQIQVATDNQFEQIAQNLNTSSTNQSITLERGIAYYWRVKAVDSKNAESVYSSIFQLYTEGEGVINHLPFSPVLVKPVLNSTEQNATTTLEWTANDVDNDPLIYDIYFGVENPPVSVFSANQAGNNVDVNLSTATEYFWRVVVKDDNGGKTIGQVWTFKTD